MKILFITATRLGDAVISTGLLDMLIGRYPSARITVVCGPVAAGLFAACPNVEKVVPLVKLPHDRHWFQLWRQCVGTRWSKIVDLRGSGVSFFLRSRSRHILRGGRRPGRRIGHLGRLFGVVPPPLPRNWYTSEQKRRALARLPDGTIWLALAPTANWDGKIWPAAYFVTLAERLRLNGMAPVIFYGPGADERQRAAPVLAALPDALDLGGDYELGSVAALLGRCGLFVGNDSGLMHLAAASGIPTLGLFGPSRASEYAPAGPRAHYVEAPGPEGSGDLEKLMPDTVYEAARALYEHESR